MGEYLGLSQTTIGQVFLVLTIVVYVGFGGLSRTSDLSEDNVAGHKVPAVSCGMATAASFFSALVLGILWKRANRAGAESGMQGSLAKL